MELRAEFTVEPFRVGSPGPHVDAAIEAARAAGLEPDVGPFATSIAGAAEVVLDAVRVLSGAAIAAGATRVSLVIESGPVSGPGSRG